MKNWLSNRLDFVEKQFTPAPRLSAPGGRIPAGFTLELTSPPSATVYYTLDGSDPRLPQGSFSPKALAYTGPITLAANARAGLRTPVRGLATAAFIVIARSRPRSCGRGDARR